MPYSIFLWQLLKTYPAILDPYPGCCNEDDENRPETFEGSSVCEKSNIYVFSGWPYLFLGAWGGGGSQILMFDPEPERKNILLPTA